jgi:hypothetical protein
VGAVVLAAGVVAGLAAGSKDSSIAAECTGNRCPASAKGDIDSFHSLETVSTVAYVVGALGVVAWGTLWWLGPRSSSPATTARVWVGPASAGLTGTF